MSTTDIASYARKAAQKKDELLSLLSPTQTNALHAYLDATAEEQKERMVATSEPLLYQARIKMIRDILDQLGSRK
jgi:threonine aldolase